MRVRKHLGGFRRCNWFSSQVRPHDVETRRRQARGHDCQLKGPPAKISHIASPHPVPQMMQRAHLPASIPQPPSARRLSVESINSSLTLLSNITTFYHRGYYWTHHTHAALESAIASTIKGTITLSTDIESTLSSSPRSPPCTLSSTAGLSDDSGYSSSIKMEPFSSKMKSMDLQQRRNRKKNNFRLKLGGIAPPILKQPGMRPSQRILEMFAELIELRMESCERVANMVKDYHRDRDLQMQSVV